MTGYVTSPLQYETGPWHGHSVFITLSLSLFLTLNTDSNHLLSLKVPFCHTLFS